MQERRAAPPLSGAARRAPGARRRLLLAAALAAVVVAADQSSKSWAVHRLSKGSIHVVWKLDLVLVYNTGSSFGLAQGWAPVLGGLAALFIVGLLAFVRHARGTSLTVALGLVVGGAAGNLADRLFRGHHGAVVDFVALHFWPTFNVADSCIVVGVILAALVTWRAPAPVPDRVASAAPQQRAPDEHVPDERAPEERVPDERAPDERAPDERAPDERGPDERGPDERGPEERSAQQ